MILARAGVELNLKNAVVVKDYLISVVILVKGGDTTRRDFIEIMDPLKAVSVKCAGVIFAV